MLKRRRVYPHLLLLACLLLGPGALVSAQRSAAAESRLTGVYRLNTELSDRLYSVVSTATTSLPYGEQQRFFIDLTERMAPPDQLALRRRGRTIEIASSRAPRTSFVADGRERVERAGRVTTRERAAVEGESLVLSSEDGRGQGYKVTFTPLDGGARLRVTRLITYRELNQPLVIRSVYDRISDVARWEIYGEAAAGPAVASVVAPVAAGRGEAVAEAAEAGALRGQLEAWVEATNQKDVPRQMDFYSPRLAAYYLTRNTPREFVRAEKSKVFDAAGSVSIAAEDPEIVFLEAGRAAVMRFRKRYRIDGGPRAGRGEVVQELRWRKTSAGWKIYSERDVRVIR